jgi:hypothetical protein
MNPDIVLEVEFVVAGEIVTISTNAKFEKVEDLLEDYLHSIVGTGKDPSPMNELDVYKITLGLQLDGDVWGTSHNCGNKGLREGILMRVLRLVSDKAPNVTFKEL